MSLSKPVTPLSPGQAMARYPHAVACTDENAHLFVFGSALYIKMRDDVTRFVVKIYKGDTINRAAKPIRDLIKEYVQVNYGPMYDLQAWCQDKNKWANFVKKRMEPLRRE